MKNNDFDFIKDKFNNVEPEIPNNLNVNIIEQKILNKSSHKTIKFEQKRNNIKPLATIAACFILILGVVFALNPNLINQNKVDTINNYDDLNSKLSSLEEASNTNELGCGIFSTTKSIDEDGVETPNTIKSYDNYIFYAYYDHNNLNNRNKVYIYKTDNGNSSLVSIIDDFISDDFCIDALFVTENKLIINASTTDKTLIKIYDISNKSNPILTTEFEQSGKYGEARMIDNTLYVVTNLNAPQNDSEKSLPYIKQNNETIFVSVKNIAYFKDAKTAQYAVISSIDVETGKQLNEPKAILGGSAKIYCTKEYMYISEYFEEESSVKNNNDVMKLNLQNNKITYATEQEINKYLNATIDIGKGSNYSSTIYSIGEYFISIGQDMEQAKEEIILFDKNFNQLDIYTFDNEHIATEQDCLTVNTDNNIFALPAYFSDDTMRYYGVITFEVQNNQIVITNEFKNDDDNLMYQGKCIIIENYIYSFDINDNASDNEKLKVFSYKY
jgi:hypothetical protein